MSQAERTHVVTLLDESGREFLKSIEGLSEAQWKWKPAPNRWSVGEVAEHVVLAESGLFGRMQQALASAPNPDWEKKTAGKSEFLERVMPTRTGRAQAPDEIVPSGSWTHAETVARFQSVREKTLKFTKETEAPLKQYTAEHPFPVFGTLNAYQWLIYIPLHNTRHIKQIEEVKATAGFPQQ